MLDLLSAGKRPGAGQSFTIDGTPASRAREVQQKEQRETEGKRKTERDATGACRNRLS